MNRLLNYEFILCLKTTRVLWKHNNHKCGVFLWHFSALSGRRQKYNNLDLWNLDHTISRNLLYHLLCHSAWSVSRIFLSPNSKYSPLELNFREIRHIEIMLAYLSVLCDSVSFKMFENNDHLLFPIFTLVKVRLTYTLNLTK